MANEMQHAYITAHGEWTATPWVGEFAQIGLRCAFVPTISAPDKGALFTFPLNGEIVADTGTASGTHGTLTRTWKARIGPTGSIENLNDAEQIDFAEDMWTFLDGTKQMLNSGFRWTHVKIAGVTALGKIPRPSSTYTFTTPIAGTAAGTNKALPPEVALAVSMISPVVGKRGRGRIYMPGLSSIALESDGTFNAAGNLVFRPQLVTLINNLQNMPGLTDNIPIVVTTSAGQPDGYRPLNVRVGSHFDAQRRRQHQVPETFASTAL